MNGQLRAVAMKDDLTSNKNNVVNLKGFSGFFKVVPPMSGDFSGAISEVQSQILTACFLITELLGFNQKISADRLVDFKLINEGFHE